MYIIYNAMLYFSVKFLLVAPKRTSTFTFYNDI